MKQWGPTGVKGGIACARAQSMYHLAGLFASALGFGDGREAGVAKGETAPPTTTAPSTFYDELAALDQPLVIYTPISHRVEYWIDLGREMFAAKGLSVTSDTFALERTDGGGDTVIAGGNTNKGTAWRVAIARSKEAGRDRGYVVDVTIGSGPSMRRNLHGRTPQTIDTPALAMPDSAHTPTIVGTPPIIP